MIDFYVAAGAISSAITITQQGHKFNKSIDKIIRYIAKGSCRIIIFGAGGTGKTTLSHILSNTPITDFNYSETPTIEKVKINSNIIGHYLVAPGQERRVERYWPELYRKLGKDQITGIINVVSNGYHSIEIGNLSYKTTSYYEKESKSKFLEKYLTIQKEKEIDYLKKISEQIKTTKNKFWMITLVNKQDLWWDKKDSVKDYYVNGKYNNIIEDIYSSKGNSNFVHEYVSCALINNNFKIGSDFCKETVKGYDEPTKQENLNNFVKKLNSLINE
uniref:hypothetical protein n=1 Tax=Gelidibacter sp. TaxID=2018083 RepID=UPI00404B1217